MSVSPFLPLRELPAPSKFLKSGDTLVLVGELFSRGYANGLVEAAQNRGVRIIQATVGRRDGGDQLRALNEDEVKSLPFECVNIPLEAGFEYERGSDALHLVERLKSLKLPDWQEFHISEAILAECRAKARKRLENSMTAFSNKIGELVPSGNIAFAHLMAGGVPRSKPVLALLNRTVKGTGEKFFSSEALWKSNLGSVIAANFYEVTAHSFRILIDQTSELRFQMERCGRQVAYTAYGYHGTEILIQDSFRWQSYTPYLQGWAKIALENYSIDARSNGVLSTVYNCPEILTNSSSIFQGVEVPLYVLLSAFKKLAPDTKTTRELSEVCLSRLKSGVTLADVKQVCEDALSDLNVSQFFNYELWPSHNTQPQLAKILSASDTLMSFHRDTKFLMTSDLSEVVLKSCGQIMLDHLGSGTEPVVWLGHDVVAKASL